LTGNTPLFFLLSTVRSVGADFSAAPNGPFPFPSAPWHAAQLD